MHMIVINFRPEKKAYSRQHLSVNICERNTFYEEVKYIHGYSLSLGMYLEMIEHSIHELETLNNHLILSFFWNSRQLVWRVKIAF